MIFRHSRSGSASIAMQKRRKRMRAFIVACCAIIAIAVGAAVVLDRFVQESSSTAFTESSARIGPG
jgi:hypothetical protein